MTHSDHAERYRSIGIYHHPTDKVIFEVHDFDHPTAGVTAQDLILRMLARQRRQNDTEASHEQQS